jgi:hypothetical protein
MRVRSFQFILAGVILPSALVAQGDPRLQRVDPDARSEVARVIDSLHAVGVPAEPLIDKALEGTAKHASAALIAAAVRGWGQQLATSRAALGPRAETDAVIAGGSALRGGVSTTVLAQIAESRPGKDLVLPLTILTELINAGIPVDSAAAAVLRVSQRGGPDAQFRALGDAAATARTTPAVAGGRPATAGGPPSTLPSSGRSRGRGRP